MGGSLGAMGWGVGLLALAGGVLVLRSRIERATGGGTRAIRLSNEHAVHVVEIEGRTLLLGTGPGGPPSLLMELGSGTASEAVRGG